MELTFNESRVLGALMEKQATTPEYYPMTVNSLLAACNQKSNRDPVTDFDEEDVLEALDGLREKHLASKFHGAGARSPKYEHTLERELPLEKPERALLCVLMLRGPQTLGELRGRTERIHPFADIAEVQASLNAMKTELETPLVALLPRRPGQKEARWTHLLSGDIEALAEAEQSDSGGLVAETLKTPLDAGERESLRGEVRALRAELEALRSELEQVRRDFATFREQFE